MTARLLTLIVVSLVIYILLFFSFEPSAIGAVWLGLVSGLAGLGVMEFWD